MYRLLFIFHFSLCTFHFATVSHGLPTNTTRTATEAYVTNKTAQAIADHTTNATAHATLFASYLPSSAWLSWLGTNSYLSASITNGWTVLPHEAWITAPTGTGIAQAVVAPWTNRVTTAWQNPPDSTNWLWESDGTQITLTNYTGPNAVVIPNMLNGLPVTEIGFSALSSSYIIVDDGEYWEGLPITSISGGDNIKVIRDNACINCTNLTSVTLSQATSIEANAFNGCSALISISLPLATTIGVNAFAQCTSLTYVSLPQAATLRMFAFGGCSSLTSISLPQVTTIEYGALGYCPLLSSVHFFQNAPPEEEVYLRRTPIITNYVTSPTATWGATFGGMPVVRMGMATESLTLGGVTKSEWPASSSGVPAVWSNMVWGAAGTNATYQMSWDTTNGTFRVLEILP